MKPRTTPFDDTINVDNARRWRIGRLDPCVSRGLLETVPGIRQVRRSDLPNHPAAREGSGVIRRLQRAAMRRAPWISTC